VLITAVGGGGVGEQLIKALRLAPRPYCIVGSDIHHRSLGLADVDVPVMLPRGNAPDYIDAVLDVCKRLGVRAIFPGSEVELIALSKARSKITAAGVRLFVNTERVLEIGLDKAATGTFLSENGFEAPRAKEISSLADLPEIPFLPVVLKPSVGGGGSVNTFIAQTREELQLFGAFLLSVYPSFLAQEYVGTADAEYTVGVLTSYDGQLIHSIALRRTILATFNNRLWVPNKSGNASLGKTLVISNGVSQGDVGTFRQVTEPCERIAKAIGSRGPINIQCRLENGSVKVFEINPRFSGTASIRAMMGFNEADLLFRREGEGEEIPRRFTYREGHVVRGLRECVIDPALADATPKAGDFVWSVPALPFVYRTHDTPSNGDRLPDQLPMTVTVDPTTGLVHQVPSKEVAAALALAYEAGSELTGLMDEEGIGREYADDFLALLEDAMGTSDLSGKQVLEVGCGTGYLLSRLKSQGANVRGIEPGPHGQTGGAKYGVPVIQGLFPAEATKGTYDLIVLYLVLEHIEGRTEILSELRAHTAPGGKVCVVVQDEESFLREGDASLLFHEHYAYFTAASLRAVLRDAGAGAIRIRRSKLSKLLFATFGFDPSLGDDVRGDVPLAQSLAIAHQFRKKIDESLRKIRHFVDTHAKAGDVGIYVPGRFVNLIALGQLPVQKLRFFDDSPSIHKQFYPGVPIRIENRDDLVARPPAAVLIMSSSFGTKIKARLAPLLPASLPVVTIDELVARDLAHSAASQTSQT
jgi:carbamoyl-phosphate synthase large subunit